VTGLLVHNIALSDFINSGEFHRVCCMCTYCLCWQWQWRMYCRLPVRKYTCCKPAPLYLYCPHMCNVASWLTPTIITTLNEARVGHDWLQWRRANVTSGVTSSWLYTVVIVMLLLVTWPFKTIHSSRRLRRWKIDVRHQLIRNGWKRWRTGQTEVPVH
jgi:hypothetical protein